MIAVGHQQQLGRKTLVVMLLGGIAPGLIMLIIVAVLSFFQDYLIEQLMTTTSDVVGFGSELSSVIPLFIPALFFLSIVLGGIGIFASVLSYKFFTFTLEEFGLKLKRGVFNIEEITIPYRQMQDVNVTRPLLYRIFGLSRLVVFSAGHERPGEPEETHTVFDPIDYENAEEIRELLGRRIGVQVVEHESEADIEQKKAEEQS